MDVITKKRRIVFKPMEKLQVMEIGSVSVNFVEDLDYSIDEKYKPGLYLQTQSFLNGHWNNFVTVLDQAERMVVFRKMSGY